MNLRIKSKRRLKTYKPDVIGVPESISQPWSMDFMSDNLMDGRVLRTVNVIDDYNREGLAIDVDLSIPSLRVIRLLEQVIEWRGKPAAIRCDNDPEYVSNILITWANKHQMTILYTQPGKATQNAYADQFNRTVRQEWLDLQQCLKLIAEMKCWFGMSQGSAGERTLVRLMEGSDFSASRWLINKLTKQEGGQ